MMFSIIIPTFNRGDKISQAVDSVLLQDYENFDLIIIDDGSTDNTEEIIGMYADDRIRYYKKKNEERNIARNLGIMLAKGDYVSFLDSDDIIYTDHLTKANAFIERMSNPEVIHLNFELIGMYKYPSLIKQEHIDKVNEKIISENILSCNSIFIKRTVAGKIQFLASENAVVGEDYYLWLRLASRYKIHLSLDVTNGVTLHKERSLNTIDVKKLELGTKEIQHALSADEVFMKYYGWKAKRYFANRYIFLALHLATNDLPRKSLFYLASAFYWFPPSLATKRALAVIKNLIF